MPKELICNDTSYSESVKLCGSWSIEHIGISSLIAQSKPNKKLFSDHFGVCNYILFHDWYGSISEHEQNK